MLRRITEVICYYCYDTPHSIVESCWSKEVPVNNGLNAMPSHTTIRSSTVIVNF